jgi:intracellular multiplication protein IcmV
MSDDSGSKRGRMRRLIDKYVDFKTWMDIERSKSINGFFLNIIRRIFLLQKPDPKTKKTFETVMQEMQLTDKDITERLKTFKLMYLIMLLAAFLFYAYAIYEVMYGGILSMLLSGVFSFVCLALAFRYHFWHYQIKVRKLGCSLKEWFRNSFMGGRT